MSPSTPPVTTAAPNPTQPSSERPVEFPPVTAPVTNITSSDIVSAPLPQTKSLPSAQSSTKPELVKTLPIGIDCKKPDYPFASKRLEEEGTVALKIFIGTDGNVFKISVEKSSGFKRLDDAARTEAMRWRFKPATLDGKPIEHSFTTSFKFNLDSSPNQTSKENDKPPC
jgi:protein TonB